MKRLLDLWNDISGASGAQNFLSAEEGEPDDAVSLLKEDEKGRRDSYYEPKELSGRCCGKRARWCFGDPSRSIEPGWVATQFYVSWRPEMADGVQLRRALSSLGGIVFDGKTPHCAWVRFTERQHEFILNRDVTPLVFSRRIQKRKHAWGARDAKPSWEVPDNIDTNQREGAWPRRKKNKHELERRKQWPSLDDSMQSQHAKIVRDQLRLLNGN